jgi:DNA-binding NarL/FixJ family response regulator
MRVHQSIDEESEKAGCDGFLAKPLEVDRLLSILQVHADLRWVIDEDCERTVDRLEQRSSAAEALIPPSPDALAVLIDLAMKGELPL